MAEGSKEQWNDLPTQLVADRLSFVPGDRGRQSFDLTYREIAATDAPQVSRIVKHAWHKNADSLIRLCTLHTGWTGRLVLRNRSAIVAMYLGQHLMVDGYNDLKFFWAHPDYYTTKVPLRLLALARLELPELPTKVSVDASATELHKLLLDAGWTDLTDVPDNDRPTRREFRIACVAGREYHEALAKGSAARQPSARGDRGGRGE